MPPNWIAFKTTYNPGKYHFSSFLTLRCPFTSAILWQRKNGTSFISIHECCFYSKCSLWRECKWTRNICKFTCISREGKWGLVLRFLGQAPWVRRLRKGVSITELQRTSCLRRERRKVGCYTAASIPEPAYKSECNCQTSEGVQWKNGLHWHEGPQGTECIEQDKMKLPTFLLWVLTSSPCTRL